MGGSSGRRSRICFIPPVRDFTPGGGYCQATWAGISGDSFHDRFAGGDFTIVGNPWLDKHIRSKGELGRAGQPG